MKERRKEGRYEKEIKEERQVVAYYQIKEGSVFVSACCL